MHSSCGWPWSVVVFGIGGGGLGDLLGLFCAGRGLWLLWGVVFFGGEEGKGVKRGHVCVCVC